MADLITMPAKRSGTAEQPPAPLVPSQVDLSDFGFMPLEVRRLRDSKIAAAATGDEFRAAVLLWCASWHQKPAASLPDDDIELSQFSGFGRVISEWLKVKAGAMYGWIKCADNRWYHPVVAEKAIEAWNGKLEHGWRRECDRLRKENERRKQAAEPPLPTPPKPAPLALGIPTDAHSEFLRTSVGVPAENALKGQGQGQGQGRGGAGGTASPPPGAEIRKVLTGESVALPPKRQRINGHRQNNLGALESFIPAPDQLARLRMKAPRVADKLELLAERFRTDPWYRPRFEKGQYSDPAKTFENFVLREEERARDKGVPTPAPSRPSMKMGDDFDG